MLLLGFGFSSKEGTIFFFVLILFSGLTYSTSQDISVLIERNARKVEITGRNLIKKNSWSNHVHKLSGMKTIRYNCDTKENAINHQDLYVSLINKDQEIKINNVSYPGEIKIRSFKSKNSCDIVSKMDIEKYIQLLLTKEMNPNWPVEVLKAQAIAARSYAFYKMNLKSKESFSHLENSEKDQVIGNLNMVNYNAKKAAGETRGLILVNKSNKLTPVFYHSKCGGKTYNPKQIWGNKVNGYSSVSCPFCSGLGKKDWNNLISFNKLSKTVSKGLRIRSKIDSISIFPGSRSSNKISLAINNSLYKIKKSKLRTLLGRKILPSNNFHMSYQTPNFLVQGQGYGHGVGMCQLGALKLAKIGTNYKQILKYYFPGLEIVNLSNI